VLSGQKVPVRKPDRKYRGQIGAPLKIGARRHDYLAPDLAVSLLQQTPLDIVLGDVLLAGPRSVVLLEFKRATARPWKERSKLVKTEALLERSEFQGLQTISDLGLELPAPSDLVIAELQRRSCIRQ
jgi:hypothetical protein